MLGKIKERARYRNQQSHTIPNPEPNIQNLSLSSHHAPLHTRPSNLPPKPSMTMNDYTKYGNQLPPHHQNPYSQLSSMHQMPYNPPFNYYNKSQIPKHLQHRSTTPPNLYPKHLSSYGPPNHMENFPAAPPPSSLPSIVSQKRGQSAPLQRINSLKNTNPDLNLYRPQRQPQMMNNYPPSYEMYGYYPPNQANYPPNPNQSMLPYPPNVYNQPKYPPNPYMNAYPPPLAPLNHPDPKEFPNPYENYLQPKGNNQKEVAFKPDPLSIPYSPPPKNTEDQPIVGMSEAKRKEMYGINDEHSQITPFSSSNPTVPARSPSPPPEEQASEEVKLEPCPDCGRKFNPKALSKHITICKKLFGTKLVAKDGSKRRMQGTEFEKFTRIETRHCPFCGRDFNDDNHLNVHINVCSKNPDARKIDPKSTPIKHTPCALSKNSHSQKEKSTQCNICHGEIFDDVCSVCGAIQIPFSLQEKNDNEDISTPSKVTSDGMMECPECGRKFRPESFETHTNVCKKIFGTKAQAKSGSLMRTHGTVLAKYTGYALQSDMSYCPYCNRGFLEKRYMDTHAKTCFKKPLKSVDHSHHHTPKSLIQTSTPKVINNLYEKLKCCLFCGVITSSPFLSGKFCGNCGHGLTVTQRSEIINDCPNCNHPRNPSFKYCEECGTFYPEPLLSLPLFKKNKMLCLVCHTSLDDWDSLPPHRETCTFVEGLSQYLSFLIFPGSVVVPPYLEELEMKKEKIKLPLTLSPTPLDESIEMKSPLDINSHNSPSNSLSSTKKWQIQHQFLQNIIQNASNKKNAPLPANVMAEALESDFIDCPYCKRKFSPKSIERHIEICSKVVNKPKFYKRNPTIPYMRVGASKKYKNTEMDNAYSFQPNVNKYKKKSKTPSTKNITAEKNLKSYKSAPSVPINHFNNDFSDSN